MITPNLDERHLEVEQAVLAACLCDSGALLDVSELLDADSFGFVRHKQIFRLMRWLHDRGVPIDAITVGEQLERTMAQPQNSGKKIDWNSSYLVQIINESSFRRSNVTAYARIVRDHAMMRKLHWTLESIRSIDAPADETLSQAMSMILDLCKTSDPGGLRDSRSVVQSLYAMIEAEVEQTSEIIGLETGFSQIDELQSGLKPGHLIVIAGRPGMGKTTLGLNIAETVCLAGKTVAVFSTEMTAERLMRRMLGSIGKIPNGRLMAPKRFVDRDWSKLTGAINEIAESRIWIDDSAELDMAKIHHRAKRLQGTEGLDLVVIDYLQMLQPPKHSRREPRESQVREMSGAAVRMAKDLRVPVILLSQLNRELERRTNKRPIMSDLRESGAIEQDADLILFVYRDEAYNPQPENAGVAELIVGKNRDGSKRTTPIYLQFDGPHYRFNPWHGTVPRLAPGGFDG